MKRLLLAAVAAIVALAGCRSNVEKTIATHPEWAYNSVVYEINIRQFSEEGTFAAVEAQLPRLKELGVDVLWLMPMYKIGEEGRKGTLGSYYAISDYCSTNPEFGTMEDFQSLLDAAHSMGFKVILDWVANQTAPDHIWMTEKPADFYERDAEGNAIYEYDWTDTRSLNYENKEVWAAQDSCMRFWLEKGVDGFRCDAAGEVPADFWYGILPGIRRDYPEIYLLAEAETPKLSSANSEFEATYAWKLHHLLNDIAQGKAKASAIRKYVVEDDKEMGKEGFRLMFTSNHDENSWSGSEFERMGDAANVMEVLCFTLPKGHPLIYTGQEVGVTRRIEFFEKDPVTDWSENEYTAFFKTLVKMRHENPALQAGSRGGDIRFFDNVPEDVLAFSRSLGGNEVVVIANLSAQKQTVSLSLDGEYTSVFSGIVMASPKSADLAPWGYMVLAKNSESPVGRVEPLSWWTGMKMPLQLMVKGDRIASCNVRIEGGKGVSVKSVTPGDSQDYLFVDVAISASAEPGTYDLVFSDGEREFSYPYRIEARAEGSAERKSFTTADMIYLVFPDRFANGDPANDSVKDMAEPGDRSLTGGRHGGDIQGIIDHLDYIAGLGATAIWSTPLLVDDEPEGSYHGYACGDYYHIDPRFGSNGLYREMVSKAHEKGLKVIMDIVTNHCGTAHWWMDDLPFKDWIHVFPEFTGSNVAFSTNMDPNASKYDLNLQESGWFVPSMPDMNLDNPFMLKYFQQWAIWWIEYSGLDGFRVDTYPYNEKVPMSKWCAAVLEEYPDFNIVGECWTSSHSQLAYWQAGNGNKDGFNSNLPTIMDFPLQEAIVAAMCERGDNPGWGQGMARVYDCLSHDFVYHDLSHMMIFLANHDHARLGDIFGSDPSKMKVALAMLATMRGIPQLYNGDEMMFKAFNGEQSDPARRVDFPGGWADDKTDLFSADGRKGVAAELHDYTARLFNWRKEKSVLHDGKTLHFLGRDNTYAYFRYNETEAVFVFVNNTGHDVIVPWDHYAEFVSGPVSATDVVSGMPVTLGPGLTVPAGTALIAEFDR